MPFFVTYAHEAVQAKTEVCQPAKVAYSCASQERVERENENLFAKY